MLLPTIGRSLYPTVPQLQPPSHQDNLILPSYLRNPGPGEMSTNYKLIQNESAGAQTKPLTLKPVRACQIWV